MFCRELPKDLTHIESSQAALALDKEGKLLAYQDSENSVAFWDLVNWNSLELKKKLPERELKELFFTPDGRLIALLALEEKHYFWDVQKAQYLSPKEVEDIHASLKGLSRDGQILTTGGGTKESKVVKKIHKRMRDAPGVTVLISPNRALLAIKGRRGSDIKFWDIAHDIPLEPFKMIEPGLLGFSPDGKILMVIDERMLVCCDLEAHRSWNFPLSGLVRNCAWSGNGKILAVIERKKTDRDSDSAVIKIIDLDIASWPEKACRIANRNLTHSEWRRYVGDVPYQRVCPKLPEPKPEKTLIEDLETEEAKE